MHGSIEYHGFPAHCLVCISEYLLVAFTLLGGRDDQNRCDEFSSNKEITWAPRGFRKVTCLSHFYMLQKRLQRGIFRSQRPLLRDSLPNCTHDVGGQLLVTLSSSSLIQGLRMHLQAQGGLSCLEDTVIAWVTKDMQRWRPCAGAAREDASVRPLPTCCRSQTGPRHDAIQAS